MQWDLNMNPEVKRNVRRKSIAIKDIVNEKDDHSLPSEDILRLCFEG
jgi:hypothetical protein